MNFKLKDYRAKPGDKVKLDNMDPDDTGDYDAGKRTGKELLQELTDRLEILQERLYSAHKHSVLVLLQEWIPAGRTAQSGMYLTESTRRGAGGQLQSAHTFRIGS